MDPDEKLHKELKEQTASITAPSLDLPFVLTRGRRLRRRRRIVASFSGTVVISVAVLLVFNVSMIDRPESARTHLDPANDSPEQGPKTDGAATFSIRAIAQARLLDPSGDFYDYQGIEATDNGWVSTFDATECIVTDVIERCVERTDADGVLQIELRDEDQYVVAAADGPFSETARERLLAYSEVAAPEDPRWEFPFVTMGGVGGNLVETSGIWTGPIPALEHGEQCRAQLVDETGNIIWEGELLDLSAPSHEEFRSGGILSAGGLSSAIEESDSLSSKISNAIARMACNSWSGEGWKPIEIGSIEQISGAPEMVAVPLRLRWNDEPFEEAYTRCTVTVFGRDGTIAGKDNFTLAGPDGSQKPPFDERQSIPISVGPGSVPERAETRCSLITAEEFEQD